MITNNQLHILYEIAYNQYNNSNLITFNWRNQNYYYNQTIPKPIITLKGHFIILLLKNNIINFQKFNTITNLVDDLTYLYVNNYIII